VAYDRELNRPYALNIKGVELSGHAERIDDYDPRRRWLQSEADRLAGNKDYL